MPLIAIGAIGAGTSLLGGLFGSSASEQAAKEQIAAEQKAGTYLEGQLGTGEGNYNPYLSAGGTASTTLSSLLGTPGQGLLTPWTQQFTAPTAAQAAATPGYQFQLQQGLDAAQNSAAGQGGLLSGRTLASLNNYAQGTASTNYQNTFNNDLTSYQSAYNTFLNNQNNQYSRLMGVAGQGLTAAQGDAGLISGVGGDIASLMGAQGASQAAGTVGAANAWSGALSGAGNAISSGLLLSALNGNSQFALANNPDYGSFTGTPASAGYSNPYGPYVAPPTGSSGLPGTVPGFALGTDFAPGGPAMVGEAGPEMVNLPRGSQVIPNPSTLQPGAPTSTPMQPLGDPRMMPRFGFPANFPMYGAQQPMRPMSALA